MARMAKTAKAAPARKAAKPGTARRTVTAKPAAKPAPPKLSKDELRARVERLERANVTLRGKNRVLGAALRQADERVVELEAQVARFERSAKPAPVRRRKAAETVPVGAVAPVDDTPPDAVPPPEAPVVADPVASMPLDETVPEASSLAADEERA